MIVLARANRNYLLIVAVVFVAGVVILAAILVAALGSHATNAMVTTVCVQSAPIGALRIRIVSDNPANVSVEGATISGYVSVACGIEPPPSTTVVQVPIASAVTPANGTITNPQPGLDGTYSLTVAYSGSDYHFEATTSPEQITFVTLSVPSGSVNVTSAVCYPHYETVCGFELVSPQG